jgi:hypothetical protein
MYRHIKYLVLILIMLLALYPIAELTRVILISGEFYFPEMKGQFAAEIAIMWVLYLSIVPLFLMINNRRLRHYRNIKMKILKRTEGPRDQSLGATRHGDYIRVNYLK